MNTVTGFVLYCKRGSWALLVGAELKHSRARLYINSFQRVNSRGQETLWVNRGATGFRRVAMGSTEGE